MVKDRFLMDELLQKATDLAKQAALLASSETQAGIESNDNSDLTKILLQLQQAVARRSAPAGPVVDAVAASTSAVSSTPTVTQNSSAAASELVTGAEVVTVAENATTTDTSANNKRSLPAKRKAPLKQSRKATKPLKREPEDEACSGPPGSASSISGVNQYCLLPEFPADESQANVTEIKTEHDDTSDGSLRIVINPRQPALDDAPSYDSDADESFEPSRDEMVEDSDEFTEYESCDEAMPKKPSAKAPAKKKSGAMRYNDVCKLCVVSHKLEKRDNMESVFDELDSNDGGKSKFPIYESVPDLAEHIKCVHAEISHEDGASSATNDTNDEDTSVPGDSQLRKAQLISRRSVEPVKAWVACPYPKCKKTYAIHSTVKACYHMVIFHMYKKHNECVGLPNGFKIHCCDQCSYQSLRGRELAKHKRILHTDVDDTYRRVPCPLCGKMMLKYSLSIHMASVHGSEDVPEAVKRRASMLECDQCGKRFRGPAGLEKHKKCVHEQIKEHLCELCSHTFFAKRDLQLHMFASHKINMDNIKVLKCEVEGCNYETLDRRHLLVHTQIHRDTKDFTCERCGKMFKTKPAVTQHLRIMHTRDTVYNCPQCPFSSHAKQYVKRHMIIHTGIKGFKCAVEGCTYETYFIENLNKHKRRHANNNAKAASQ